MFSDLHIFAIKKNLFSMTLPQFFESLLKEEKKLYYLVKDFAGF